MGTHLTSSLRRFLYVPTINVLSKNKKNVLLYYFSSYNIDMLTSVNRSILHRGVIAMKNCFETYSFYLHSPATDIILQTHNISLSQIGGWYMGIYNRNIISDTFPFFRLDDGTHGSTIGIY